MSRTSCSLASACLIFAIALTGCGAVQQARQAAARANMMNQLKMLGLAYHQCHDKNQRGPLNWQEAEQNGLPSEVRTQLESAGYTVHWGVKMVDAVGGTSAFVLAHPADAATAGGAILMLDGSVMQMTAQEFDAALAQQKIDSPKAMATAAGGGDAGGGAAPPAADGAGPPPAAPGY